MKSNTLLNPKDVTPSAQRWPWWPLLPLYPYGRRRTFFKEVISSQIWSFEQLQGLYYVAVPVRLTVVKVRDGLMLFNPLPPTQELLSELSILEKEYGPVLSIILPTASGLEHKISLPALSRAFPKAALWVCPGQWSFPMSLPLELLGIPRRRTKVLINDGFPHPESCIWFSLGPLDIGLGRFQEISCFHKATKSLLVTDALVAIEAQPPALFDLDPTPLLFHSRDKGDQILKDSLEARRKGWLRLVLFASFLKPAKLSIPPLINILKNSFKPGVRNIRAHFGLFPFVWADDWENSTKEIVGTKEPLISIAPVIQRLVFPRAKSSFIEWLDKIISLKGVRWLIPAHYSAPVKFTNRQVNNLKVRLDKSIWPREDGNWVFLGELDKSLLDRGIVPSEPMSHFKD